MKKILLVATLASGVAFAGGDDRDNAPVEPMFDKVVVKDESAKTMTLTQPVRTRDVKVREMVPEPVLVDKVTNRVVKTPTGKPITVRAHQNCKDKLELSDENIERFKTALAGKYLYNTGPINARGTEFSPKRWDDYFDCIEQQ